MWLGPFVLPLEWWAGGLWVSLLPDLAHPLQPVLTPGRTGALEVSEKPVSGLFTVPFGGSWEEGGRSEDAFPQSCEVQLQAEGVAPAPNSISSRSQGLEASWASTTPTSSSPYVVPVAPHCPVALPSVPYR